MMRSKKSGSNRKGKRKIILNDIVIYSCVEDIEECGIGLEKFIFRNERKISRFSENENYIKI